MPATTGRARKQWQIQDGPHGTLRRLRSQLAEDGCAESQVVLAKHLLHEAQGLSASEDEKLAVQWLLRAAEQDNAEAVQLLQECIKTGRGITEQNFELVQQSLNLRHEKEKALQVAKDLYADLHSQNEELCRTVKRTKNAVEDRLSSDSEESAEIKFVCEDGNTYTEEDVLIAANQAKAREDPCRSMDKALEKEAYEQLTLRQKILQEPLLTLRISYAFYLESLATVGPKTLRLLLHPNKFHLLVVLLTWTLSFRTAVELLPVLVFYVCLASMTVATAIMLGASQWLHDLRPWQRLLQLDMLKPNTTFQEECCFSWNSTWPYLTFFSVLLPLLIVYPLVTDWVPTAECTVLSLMLAIPSLAAIMERYEWITTTSIGLCLVLQLLPRLLLSVPTWAYIGDILPCFGVFPVTSHFLLHVGIPSLLYLFVPAIFCVLATQHSWQTIYRIIISHMVCVTWFQLACVFFVDSSAKGIAWAFLIAILLLLLLPLATVLAFLFIGYVLVWLAHAIGALIPLFVWFSLLAIPLLLQHYLSRNILPQGIAWVRWVCYSIAAILFLYFLGSLSSHHLRVQTPPPPTISWSTYYNACHQPAWMERTQANVEFGCLHLRGVAVSWEGSVEAVRITQMDNKMEVALSLLPQPFQKWVRCKFGKPYDACDETMPACAMLKDVRQEECDISQWSQRSFELVLTTTNWLEPANFFVIATCDFESFMVRLHRGDSVNIKGTLFANLGGGRPTVELEAIRCILCVDKNLSPLSLFTDSGFTNSLSKSVHFVIHFLFSPILEYQDEPLMNVEEK